VNFVPSRLLPNAHLQTLSTLIPLRKASNGVRDAIVHVPLAATMASRPAGSTTMRLRLRASRAPVVLLIHGVGGAASSNYVQRGATAFFEAGYHVARLNLRGADESVYNAPDLYHMGLAADLVEAVRMLSRRADVLDVVVLGYSGGGSLSLKAAAIWSALRESPVLKVAALSPPIDLVETRANIELARYLPYHMHVLRGLHRSARRFALRKKSPAPYTLKDIALAYTVREFDRRITVPMHGFDSVHHYDETSSALHDLPNIKIPTLIVHAKDDPMVPVSALERALKTAAPDVSAQLTNEGGHLGWAAAIDESSLKRTWAISQVLQFFER
jgi:predicted alpha/beta-fold hydrolase